MKKVTVFDVVNIAWMTIFAIFCLLPAVIIITGSLTDNESFSQYGYSIFPHVIDFTAYQVVFKAPEQLLNAYGISILVTVVGTVINVFATALIAFPLSRADFAFKKPVLGLLLVVMLFNGGLVPNYILITQYLGWKDNLLALIVPGIASPFYIILMRTFFKTIPNEIFESAKLDGCSDFGLFFKMLLPLSLASLATCSILISLNYWNDWYSAMLYIEKTELRPLQLLMTKIAQDAELMKQHASMGGMGLIATDLPTEAVSMATCIVGTAPVLVIFLFLQKYIVRGMTVGAVKG